MSKRGENNFNDAFIVCLCICVDSDAYDNSTTESHRKLVFVPKRLLKEDYVEK